jgi:N-acetylglucosaminyldiphosphoundecaprenol N-acetyl-beta-D-mannosaminyltransferase
MQVLGVELKDYTVREAMRKADAFLKENKVSTIAYITTTGLMAAEESEDLKLFLSNIDLTVAADSDILSAAGIANRNRVKEIENDEFMEEFLKKLVRGKRKVYLLTGTGEQLSALEECLKSYQESLRVVGRFALDTLEKDEDWLINEMNAQMPDVVISNIDSPQRESFLKIIT